MHCHLLSHLDQPAEVHTIHMNNPLLEEHHLPPFSAIEI
ncbi:MAG: hypothetical protein ACI8VY_000185, partial [Cellvibrionaceae bacterium]